MELRKDVHNAILRQGQRVGAGAEFGQLEKIYGKDVIDFHVDDLIQDQLIAARVIRPRVHINILGLTAAGHRRLGSNESGPDGDSE